MVKTTTRIVVEVSREYRIWEATAKENTRPVLTGVYLDPKGYMVGADGFMLAVIPCKMDGKLAEGVIVPATVLQAGGKSRKPSSEKIIFIVDTVQLSAQLVDNGSTITADLIMGTYPDWRILIPKLSDMGVPVKELRYNPGFVLRLGRAVGVDIPVLVPTKGHGPAVIPGLNGAFGLLMPMFADPVDRDLLARIAKLRPPQVKVSLPAWAKPVYSEAVDAEPVNPETADTEQEEENGE